MAKKSYNLSGININYVNFLAVKLGTSASKALDKMIDELRLKASESEKDNVQTEI